MNGQNSSFKSFTYFFVYSVVLIFFESPGFDSVSSEPNGTDPAQSPVTPMVPEQDISRSEFQNSSAQNLTGLSESMYK